MGMYMALIKDRYNQALYLVRKGDKYKLKSYNDTLYESWSFIEVYKEYLKLKPMYKE